MPEKFRFLFSLISYIFFFYQKVKTHLTIKSPLCCSNKVQKVNFPSSHQHDKSQSPTMILWFIRHVYLVIQINIFSYIFDLHPSSWRKCVSQSVVSDSLWPSNCSPPGFSVKQEYWSGLPFPSPEDLPDLGIEPGSPALQAVFNVWATGKSYNFP